MFMKERKWGALFLELCQILCSWSKKQNETFPTGKIKRDFSGWRRGWGLYQDPPMKPNWKQTKGKTCNSHNTLLGTLRNGLVHIDMGNWKQTEVEIVSEVLWLLRCSFWSGRLYKEELKVVVIKSLEMFRFGNWVWPRFSYALKNQRGIEGITKRRMQAWTEGMHALLGRDWNFGSSRKIALSTHS